MAKEARPIKKRLRKGPSKTDGPDELKHMPDDLIQTRTLNRKATACDMPNEIRLNIASHLNFSALRSLALVNKSFYVSTEPLLWTAIACNVVHLPDCQYQSVSRQIELPTIICADTARWIKRLKIYVDTEPHWRKATWKLNGILQACMNVEHVELALPLRHLNLRPGELLCRSLCISKFILPNRRLWSSRSIETLRIATFNPHLRNLEFHSCEKIGDAIKILNLHERSLPIKTLAITARHMGSLTGIGSLIEACHALENLHIEQRVMSFNERFGHPSACVEALSPAFYFQRRSLRTMSVTQKFSDANTAPQYWTIDGSLSQSTILRGMRVLTRLSVPLYDLHHFQVYMHLPSLLRLFQIQVDAIDGGTQYMGAERHWDKAQKTILQITEAVVRIKSIRCCNLQQLIWWYNGVHVNEGAVTHSDSRNEFRERVAQIASDHLEMVWSGADILEKTPFSTEVTDSKWRDGGLCTAEEAQVQQEEGVTAEIQ